MANLGRCICCKRPVGGSRRHGVVTILPASQRVSMTWCMDCKPKVRAAVDRMIRELERGDQPKRRTSSQLEMRL